MKRALALLLLAAPLSAQTPSSQNIVVKLVITLVPTGSSTSPITPPTPVIPPIIPPVIIPPTPPTPPTPPIPTPPTPPTTPTGSCTNNYPQAVKSMNDVSTDLLQVQQLYAAALTRKIINPSTYSTGANALSQVRLDNGDVRDMVRIAGPSKEITQNITFVSEEISTFPGLLGNSSQLSSNLNSLVSSMQSSLNTASGLVSSSTCPGSVP